MCRQVVLNKLATIAILVFAQEHRALVLSGIADIMNAVVSANGDGAAPAAVAQAAVNATAAKTGSQVHLPQEQAAHAIRAKAAAHNVQ